MFHFSFLPQGPNALVTYTIISGADDSFRIDPESGDLIATKKLDRERRSKYSLLVRADDGQQSSDMTLNITVKDVNDHTPKFSRSTYSFDIPEDMAPGEDVVSLNKASTECRNKAEDYGLRQMIFSLLPRPGGWSQTALLRSLRSPNY